MKIVKLNYYINPHFILKYYLFRDIQKIVKKYEFIGSIMDVGCGEKPYANLFSSMIRYLGIDFRKYSQNKTFVASKPDYYFSKKYSSSLKLPFKDQSFDNVVSFQVIEHHRNPSFFIKEIVRITKRNGYILITFPFIFGLHEKPSDYYRLTKYGMWNEFGENGCVVLETLSQGAFASTLIILLIDYFIEISNRNSAYYLIAISFSPLLLFASYFCILLDRIFKSENITINYLVLVQKK